MQIDFHMWASVSRITTCFVQQVYMKMMVCVTRVLTGVFTITTVGNIDYNPRSFVS